jgi:hypothetical protein
MKKLLALAGLILLAATASAQTTTNVTVTVTMTLGQWGALTNATRAHNQLTTNTFTPQALLAAQCTNFVRQAVSKAQDDDFATMRTRFLRLTPAQRRAVIQALP